MKANRYLLRPRRARGTAALELALLLPALIFLAFPIVDLARAIQSNLILTAMTREGASIVSRTSAYEPKDIMRALVATSPPLDMPERGMLYITKIMGYSSSGTVKNIVLEQYKWTDGWGIGGAAAVSRVWNGCGGWDSSSGKCSTVASNPASAPVVTLMAGQLADGEVIYAVEAYYHFDALFPQLSVGSLSMPVIGPDLYSRTVF